MPAVQLGKLQEHIRRIFVTVTHLAKQPLSEFKYKLGRNNSEHIVMCAAPKTAKRTCELSKKWVRQETQECPVPRFTIIAPGLENSDQGYLASVSACAKLCGLCSFSPSLRTPIALAASWDMHNILA